jgi:hypothetical protein
MLLHALLLLLLNLFANQHVFLSMFKTSASTTKTAKKNGKRKPAYNT